MNPTITPEQIAAINASIAKINEGSKQVGAQYGVNLQQLSPLAGSNIVSGSSSIVTGEKDTTNKVTNLISTLPEAPVNVDNTGITTAFNQSQTLLQNYMKQLEERRAREVEGINKGFDIAGKKQEVAQANEKGSTSVGLARMGGYLGGSGSGTGVMLTLAQSHRDEVTALEAQRQEAIRKANIAVEDKQFALARSMVDDAKQFEEQIYQRNKDFWNRQLQYQQEVRTQDAFLQDKYKDELTALTTVGAEASPEKAEEIDNFFGIKGFTSKYLKIAKVDAEAKTSKARYDSFKSKIELLESIQAGMKIQFGDEIITGIGKTSDISTFHVEDAAGNVTLVTHDKRSGSIFTQNLGAIGTPSSTGGGGSDKVSVMNAELNALANPETGYVSPTDYKNGLKVWLSVSGNTLKTYENNFKIYADPSQKEKYDFSSYYNRSSDDLLRAFLGGE